jgi:DNA-binding NarL/FixJ family response regulator
MRSPDWIALVEAAYDYAAGDAWLAGVLRAARPLFPSDAQVTAFSAVCSPTRFGVLEVAVPPEMPELAGLLRAANSPPPPLIADACYRSGQVVGSLSASVFAPHPELRASFTASSGGHFRDAIGIAAHTGEARLVMFSALIAREARPTRLEQRRWPRAAAHVAAGLRLRAKLGLGEWADDAVEAVLDGGGRLVEARGAARNADARASLRDAVRRIDRIRGADARRDGDALGAWEALVAGRWSLVDRFESDGRRFVVAVPNDPAHADPRGLTPREHQVATFVGLGHASKQIAYTLGLSTASVTTHASRAAAKLGMRSRAELAAFFSPLGVRARLAEVAIAGDRFLVGTSSALDEACLAPLTPSEREVAALLVAGSSNAEIARKRGASARTVANQARAIYRKLGICSRVELAAAIAPTGGAAQPGRSRAR